MITVDDVKKCAGLARIDISDTEAEHLGGEITSILGYIDQIKNAQGNTNEEAIGPHNVLREDSNPHQSGIHTAELLAAAPDADKHYLKVKNIL